MLPELINEKFEYEFSNLWVGLLGEVVSYSKSKAEAEVQPLLKVKNGSEFVRLPIVKCPVSMSVGNGILVIPDYKKGDIVELKGNIYPISNQLKGQSENANSLRFQLSNCSIIGSHPKRPFTVNPLVQKDGLVITDNSSMVCQFSDSKIELKLGSNKVTIESNKITLEGDVVVKGKLDVDQDISWNNGTVKTTASTHTHGTGVGPSSSPTAGS